MDSLKDAVLKNAKSIATFVLAVILQAVTDAFQTGEVPDTWQDWLRYLGLSLGAAAVVWITNNKLDLGQVLSATKKLPPTEQATVAAETLDDLPNPLSDGVVADYRPAT